MMPRNGISGMRLRTWRVWHVVEEAPLEPIWARLYEDYELLRFVIFCWKLYFLFLGTGCRGVLFIHCHGCACFGGDCSRKRRTGYRDPEVRRLFRVAHPLPPNFQFRSEDHDLSNVYCLCASWHRYLQITFYVKNDVEIKLVIKFTYQEGIALCSQLHEYFQSVTSSATCRIVPCKLNPRPHSWKSKRSD